MNPNHSGNNQGGMSNNNKANLNGQQGSFNADGPKESPTNLIIIILLIVLIAAVAVVGVLLLTGNKVNVTETAVNSSTVNNVIEPEPKLEPIPAIEPDTVLEPDSVPDTVNFDHTEGELNGGEYAILEYRDIKICIDGEIITPTDADGNFVEAFIIDGTTYLPVRAVTNAFGKEVSWDENTHTLYISEKTEAKYMDAFKADIEDVIATYGRYVTTEWAGVKGLKYGELIDFEDDGVPELVLIHDWIVEIYRFDGEKSTKIYELKAGASFRQTDVECKVGINTTLAEPCVITYQSPSTWTTEVLHIFTVKNGKPNIQIMYAGGAIFQESVPFSVYKIDDINVSEEAYVSLKNKIFNGAKEIEACWGFDFVSSGNYVHGSDEELDLFLKQFGL